MTDPQSGWADPGQPSPGWNGPPQYQQPGWPGAPQPQAPKPGVIPLRPLGVGEILDGAISYIRANPLVTLGLAAVVMVITQLVQIPAQYLYFGGIGRLSGASEPSVSEVASVLGGGITAGLLGAAVHFLAGTVLTGMLIVVLSRAVLGRRTDLSSAWVTVRSRVPGLLGLSLITGLLLLAPPVAAAVPVVLAAVAGAPVWVPVVIGLVTVPAALCVVVYLWVALAMAAPAYILERIGVLTALSRSRRLARPAWWRVFGILLLGALIAGVISSIIAVPFTVASGVLNGAFSGANGAPTGLGGLVIIGVGTIIGGTITAPFAAGVTGLLYFDQRIRREGWDLELARAAHDPTAGNQPSPGQAW